MVRHWREERGIFYLSRVMDMEVEDECEIVTLPLTFREHPPRRLALDRLFNRLGL